MVAFERTRSNLPRFIFYGGKGGVGKTTCAAARAVAGAVAGERVLVVSTDPAHSLGDALGVTLSARLTRVRAPRARSTGSLRAVELNARRAFARWLTQYRRALGDVLEQGTWLDRSDVEALLDLPVPGVDELVGLLEIMRLSTLDIADLVVVDTAPTGHTLRLLAAPDTVAAVARVLDALYEEQRVIRYQLARVRRLDVSDRLIELLSQQASGMAAVLRDRRRTSIRWVTIAEDLALAESEDAVAALDRMGLRADEIVVNRVLPDAAPCPMCDGRRAIERRVLAAIRRRLARGRRLRIVAAEIREPRGIRALARIGRTLKRDMAGDQHVGRRRAVPGSHVVLSLPKNGHALAAEALVGAGLVPALSGVAPGRRATTRVAPTTSAQTGVQLLFVGGKGGVGKSTVAAAIAVRLSRARPSTRVLLLSTDPAHSLGDVFRAAIGDTAAPVPGAPRNLFVREIDAARALSVRRARLERALGATAANVGAGVARGDDVNVADLMNLAPPGIDELFGLLSIVDARPEYDVIVVDTAPTGHTLRLLEMPEVIRDWVQVLLRVMMKYRSVVRPGEFAADLVDVSRSIRELQALLHDSTQTRFVVVTRAAEVPRAETERLVRQLRRMKLAVPAIASNAMTLAPGRCERCRATAEAERRQLGALVRVIHPRGCVIIQTPLSAPPPRGARALQVWGSRWVLR